MAKGLITALVLLTGVVLFVDIIDRAAASSSDEPMQVVILDEDGVKADRCGGYQCYYRSVAEQYFRLFWLGPSLSLVASAVLLLGLLDLCCMAGHFCGQGRSMQRCHGKGAGRARKQDGLKQPWNSELAQRRCVGTCDG
jgi:hypothetical protein